MQEAEGKNDDDDSDATRDGRRLFCVSWPLPFAFCLVGVLSTASWRHQRKPTSSTRLGVDDRDNSTPAIVARDQTVVVTWSAAIPEGGTDIFAAVSEDGGTTFHAPVRVNDLEQQARANGEQPPRAAIGPREIARRLEYPPRWPVRSADVALDRWRAEFGASAPVHPAGLTGARGWTAIAADASGAFDVAWLDGRNAAAKPAPAPAAAPSPTPGTSGAGPPQPRRGTAPGSLSRAFRTGRDAEPRRKWPRTSVSAARRRS